MAKVLSTNWKVVVNSVDLSDHAFDVQIVDTKDRVEVSGFSKTGSREFLPGLRDQTVTIQMLQDRAAGKVFQTINPLFTAGSAFPFYVQPDATAGTDSANLLYGGTAQVFQSPASATLNQREEATYEFSPAPGSVFQWGSVAP